jgi:RNA polymerase sigma-70 factor (ECF subfamily)
MSGSNDEQRDRAGGGRFTTTRWSVVLAARSPDAPPGRIALAELCATYWYPLYAYVRSRGESPDRAEDLTQAFFAQLIGKGMLRHVDPAKGKFRSFLLASMKNFITDEWKRAAALKRGGGALPISLDAVGAENRYRVELVEHLTPERFFERQWALTVIDQALLRLAQRYEQRGKLDHFKALKVFLSGEKRPVPYAQVAAGLDVSELAVKVAVHRLRKRFRDALREEIAETVTSEEEVEEELRALYAALED